MSDQPDGPRILLMRTWLKNIGNGFIEKGARALLKEAFPSAEIIETSGHPNYVGDMEASFQLRQKLKIDRSEHLRPDHPNRRRVANVAEWIDADLIVLPGCVLGDWVFRKYATTFDQLDTENTAVMFLGAGGSDYKADTQQTTVQYLGDWNVDALFTRDQAAYDHYSEHVPYSYEGIDCAFWIDEWYQPPDATEVFEARTFDKVEEPDLESNNTIIRPNHDPFGQPNEVFIKGEISKLFNRDNFTGDNLLYSDRIEDYLFIYGNAETTHTDRIHACVPTLVYGGQAQFHYDTPRAGLFENVLLGDITVNPVEIDRKRLDKLKAEQVSAVRNAYNSDRYE